MAGELGVAALETEVDLAGLDSGFDAAEGQTNSRLSNLGGVVSSALTGVVLAAVAAVVAAIVGIGVAAFDVASQFQGATASIQAQLGLTAEEAQRLGGVVEEVYRNNFGESIAEVGETVAQVVRQLSDLGVTAEGEIQAVTEAAFALRDAFGVDVGESISSVRTLMAEFGLSSTEALDLITAGFQEIPQFAQDGLDSIGEYSNLFADAGFSAEEMFSIMESGAAGGVLATDKVADAIKEMQIILNEGGEDVAAAFKDIGLNFDEIQASVAAGESDWADWFDTIIGGINDIEDPIERSRVQVEIFGTMAEDLGVSFTEGLTTAGFALDDIAGRTEGLNVQYETFGDFIQGFGRRAQLALKPIGDVLLGLAMRIMPLVEQGFSWFETTLVPVIEEVAEIFGDFFDSIMTGEDIVGDFANLGWELVQLFGATEEEALAVWQAIRDVGDKIVEVKDKIWEFLQPIVQAIANFVSWKDVLIAIGAVIGVVVVGAIISLIQALAPVIAAIAAVIGVIALLRNAWENDWGGIRTKLIEVWEGTVRPALQMLWEWLQVKVPAAIETLRRFWEGTLWPALQVVGNWMSGTLFPLLSTFFTWLYNDLVIGIQRLTSFWQTVLWPALQAVWAWMTGTLFPTLQTWWDWLNTKLTAAMQFLTNTWNNVLKPALEALWAFVRDYVIPILEALWELVEVTLTAAFTALQVVWDNVLKPAFEALWNIVETRLLPILESLRVMFAELLTNAFEVLKNIWENTLRPALDAMRGLLEGPAAGAANIFKGAIEGIGSALSGFLGMINSVIDAISNLIGWLQSLGDAQSDYAPPDLPGGGEGDPGGGDGVPSDPLANLFGFGGFGFPAGPAGGAGVTNNYNLYVTSERSTEDIVTDFWLMRAAS